LKYSFLNAPGRSPVLSSGASPYLPNSLNPQRYKNGPEFAHFPRYRRAASRAKMSFPVMRFRHHRLIFLFTMSKVPCYLRTRRKEWSLTQRELASFTGSHRGRISKVELGKRPPSALEILAYSFMFDCKPQDVFPAHAEEVEDAVMAAAYRLSERVEDDESPKARRKNELIQGMLARVTSYFDYV
jgi:transcriptional regulator with XRE-family HTH domain